MKRSLLAPLAVLFFSTAFSSTIYVPGDEPTIQAGVDAAADGDSVIVAAGVYSGVGNTNIVINGKDVLIMSESGADSTILDVASDSCAFIVNDVYTPKRVVLKGFALINADFAAVSDIFGNLVLESMVISDCLNGIYLEGYTSDTLNILNTTLRDNTNGLLSFGSGMKILVDGGEIRGNLTGLRNEEDLAVSARDVLFIDNDTALYVYEYSSETPSLDSCLFDSNTVAIRNKATATNTVFRNGETIALISYPAGVVIDSGLCENNSGPLFRTTTFASAPQGWPGLALGEQQNETGFTIRYSSFRGNGDIAIYEGGDIDNQVAFRVFNSTFVDNGAISAGNSYTVSEIVNSLFDDNGLIGVHGNPLFPAEITGCTIVNSKANALKFTLAYADYGAELSRTIVSQAAGAGLEVEILMPASDTSIFVSCSDFYSIDGGNFYNYPEQIGTDNNFSANPLFCKPDSGDYRLYDISPCAPSHNACSTLIGYVGIGCFNDSPSIVSVDTLFAWEDSMVVYRLAYENTDGPDTVILYSSAPSWLSNDYDSLFGAPQEGDGDTSFVVVVSDGYAADTQTVIVQVTTINDAPGFSPVPPKQVIEGGHLEFLLNAVDPEGDSVAITAENLPANASFADSGNGVGLFIFDPDYSQGSIYSVRFIVSDSLLADTTLSTITVVDVNAPPQFSLVAPQSLFETQELQLHLTASDFDNNPLTVSALNLPPNAMFFDSGNGAGLLQFTPDTSQAGVYSISLVASDTSLADTAVVEIIVEQVNPTVLSSTVDGQNPAAHVVDHTPLIEWGHYDPLLEKTQVSIEIAVGIDNDWSSAEIWGPVSIATPDSFVTYDGSSLADGATYYLRLKVSNSVSCSEWHESSFRMNTAPTPPTPLGPGLDVVVNEEPVLWVQNVFDAEADAVAYDFVTYGDPMEGASDTIAVSAISGAEDSTGWAVAPAPQENHRYFWQGRSFDGFEHSDWTAPVSYRVNLVNGLPTVPLLIDPSDTSFPYFELIPTFAWNKAQDFDPDDSVFYRLSLSVDSQFLFVFVTDSIVDTVRQMIDSLDFGTQYWWKVTAIDRLNANSESNVSTFWTWELGDIDHSHEVDIADLLFLVDYMFVNGPAVQPAFVADLNGDCQVDIADLLILVDYMFNDGPPPLPACQGAPVTLNLPARN